MTTDKIKAARECARKVKELEQRNAELVNEIGKPTDLPHGNGSLYARINFWKDAADMAEDRAAEKHELVGALRFLCNATSGSADELGRAWALVADTLAKNGEMEKR